MKRVLQTLEFLMLLCMGIAIAEVQSRFIQKSLHDLLQKEGISFDLRLHSPTHLTLYNIRYHHKLLAKELDLRYRLLPLLDLVLYFDSITAKGVNLNAIESFATTSKPQKSGGSLSLRPYIANLSLQAFYHYKTKNTLKLLAKEIDLQNAKIEKLTLYTFAGDLLAKGKIKNQKAYLDGALHPKLHPAKFEPVFFRLYATKKKLQAYLRTPAIHYQEAQLRQIRATIHSDYKKVLANIKAKGLYKHSRADIEATLSYQNALRYTLAATLHNPKMDLPLRYSAYQALKLKATGDLQSATIQAATPLWKIEGRWIAPHNFELHSNQLILAKIYPNLPKELQDLTLTLQAKGNPTNIDFHIDSNYALVQGVFQKPLLEAKIDFLRPIQEVRLPALNPTLLDLDLSTRTGALHTPLFEARFTPTSARIALGKSLVRIEKSEGWDMRLHTPSIQDLLTHLSELLPLPTIPNDGELAITAHYDKGRYRATIKAPKLTGEPSFLELELHGDPHRLIIDYYATYIKGHGIYATKPSIILLNDKITIERFWIEDKVLLQGHFWPKSKKGELTAVAKRYHYSSIEGEATIDADLKATLSLPKIEIDGSVWLEDGTITYAPKKIRSIEDPDIVVVDQITPKEDYFTKNVALSIHIGSKRDILYKIPGLVVWIRPDLSLYKEYQKPLELLGLLRIVRGRYEIADQYFLILPSTLSFYGPPTTPLLDLHLKTRRDRYIIFITISGDAQHPILSFDSEPYLKPNEILTLLTFGSSGELLGSTLGTGRFTSLLSNLFLKDLLKQLGLKLDTLTLTTARGRMGFEIGTHLSDKISVIYKNDEISTIIIRYELSDHIETEAIFGPSKSGVHLYYRKLR